MKVSKRMALGKGIVWLLIATFLMAFAVASSTLTAEAKSGKWKKDKTGWWYRYTDGTYPKKTWKKIGGKWYYFLPTGYMEKNCYRDGYWLNKSGVMSSKNVGGKWKKDKKGWWFTDKTGWYPKNQWLTINGKQYYFNTKGYLVTNEWIDNKCVNKDGAYVPDASTAWVDAYQKYMKENYVKEAVDLNTCDHLSFDLVYVDNNSTPELLVRSEEHGNQVDIVSYYNGKLLDLQDLGFDGAVYVKAHSGLIYEECGRQGIYHKYITKLNNGKKKVIASGTQEAQDAAMTTYTYTWNGKEVTKAEYESLPSKIYKVQKGEDVEFFTYYSYNELYMLLDSFK